MSNYFQAQNQQPLVNGGASFTPYNNPYFPMQQQRLPVYTAAPIHGENAAWQFPMGPNSDIWLPDADQDLIWWIRTDANGNKSVEPFDVNPHKKPEQADINDILARLGAVEEWINGKQNKSNAKRNAATAVSSNSVGTAESIG